MQKLPSLALLLVALTASVAAFTFPPNMCYIAQWNDGGNIAQQFPLRSNSLSSVQYYNYSATGGAAASANTVDKLEKIGTVNYFFYESGVQVSVVFIFDAPNNPAGGNIVADINSEGLAGFQGGKGVIPLLKDDPTDVYTFNTTNGIGAINATWDSCCTDGLILAVPAPPAQPSGQFNPTQYSWCLNLAFPRAPRGITNYLVRSMSDYWENGGRIGLLGDQLVNTQIAPSAANSLKLCYTQCECTQNAHLNPTKGSFNSHEVVFGATGGLNLYRAGELCSWILDYTNVTGISFFWSQFKFAQNNGDQVSFYWNTITAKPTADVSYPRTGDTRDWTANIQASQTAFPATSPFSYNSFRSPVIFPDSTTAEAFVAFTSAVDSPAHQPGFELYYIVIPLLQSVNKTVISPSGEPLQVNGYNFLNNPTSLKCGWFWSGGSQPDLVKAATFVSATVVNCAAPAHVAGSISDYMVAVSNDGGFYYSNELVVTYEICGDGIKIGKESCDDGNLVNNDGCSSTCTVEPGWICPGCGTKCIPFCGNGNITGTEQCDDGNTVSGDGCSETCQIEKGYVCSGTPSICEPVCGDGYLTPNEQCDDGNNRCGDGCTEDCKLEAGWNCPTPGKPCLKA